MHKVSPQARAAPGSLCESLGHPGLEGGPGAEWEHKTRRGLRSAKDTYYVPGVFARHVMYIILYYPVDSGTIIPSYKDGTEAWRFRVFPEMTQPAGGRAGIRAWVCPLKVHGVAHVG